MSDITYTRVSDYLLPNIKLSDPPDAPPLGRYGRMRKAFLKECRPILYSRLLFSEELYPHLREIDEVAETRLMAMADSEQANEMIMSELI